MSYRELILKRENRFSGSLAATPEVAGSGIDACVGDFCWVSAVVFAAVSASEPVDGFTIEESNAADSASAARRASALAFASSVDFATAFLRVLPSHQPPITRIAAITATATIAIITFVSMAPA